MANEKNNSVRPRPVFTLVTVLLIAFGLIFLINYFNIIPLSKIYPNFFAFLPNVAQQTSPSKYPAIDTNNSLIKAAYISYTFDAKIIDIVEIKKETERLITDAKIEGLPSIYITPVTQIFFFTPQKREKANMKSLQKNQQLTITVSFSFKNRRWRTSYVDIHVDSIPKASPSASPR